MDKVLFEITESKLETGLRGFPVGFCTTSRVDPQEGLFYIERPIREMSQHTPEEVIYLLVHGKEGNASELKHFKELLVRHSTIDRKAREAILALPKELHPMKLLVAALAILSGFELEGDYKKDAINVIAKIPEVVALLMNHHAGWGETPKSNPSLGYIENFCYMLQVPHLKDRKRFEEVMKLFNILHYDHDGGNLSVFVGKAVASGLEDMYGSIAASMCALAGPRHGKANQDCLEFIRGIERDLGHTVNKASVEALIRKRLASNELIFGFGHAVLRAEDPRATIFAHTAKQYWPEHPLVKIALLLREVVPPILQENPKIQNPFANVDLMSGALLAAAGFDYPEYFTVLFGLSRAVGIARQIVYERCEARGGKGTPIVRPKYIYKEA